MSYATTADIDSLYGSALLDMIADTTGEGVRDLAAIARAFADAEATVNSYVGAKHPLPLTSVPDVLKNLTIDIAIHRLALRPGNMTEEIKDRYDAAIVQLRDISAGRASLGFPAAAPEATAPQTAVISSNPRLFSRGSMKDF